MTESKTHKIGTAAVKLRLISSMAVLLAMVLLQSCSSADRASAASVDARTATRGGKLDACSLLTKEDAESLFGEAPGPLSNSQMAETVMTDLKRAGTTGLTGG